MAAVAIQPSVKVIGANGQISLGKQYAGCTNRKRLRICKMRCPGRKPIHPTTLTWIQSWES
jgi:hypothetical protein